MTKCSLVVLMVLVFVISMDQRQTIKLQKQ